MHKYATVAQSVEQHIRNVQVASSILVSSSNKKYIRPNGGYIFILVNIMGIEPEREVEKLGAIKYLYHQQFSSMILPLKVSFGLNRFHFL